MFLKYGVREFGDLNHLYCISLGVSSKLHLFPIHVTQIAAKDA
jgi:hypothetical protein